ncbi:MAG: transposase [Bacteroidales bacterium]|nr:transposase [Bacteroidales bacterium]
MSDKYKIKDNEAAYFITLTTVGWVDVFTRLNQKLALINSLKYCQKQKGLVIFAWCLMPSHLHMLCRVEKEGGLSALLRDFKKFTSKQIVQLTMDEPESRREWLLKHFKDSCVHLKKEQDYKVWQDGNHAVEVFSNRFIYEKLEYIHRNPVEEMIVAKPEDYLFSSARNYADLESLLDIITIDSKLITYK